jgi:hypothetical protein
MPAEDEVLTEAASITAGSWYAKPASYVWPGPRTACDPAKFQAVTAAIVKVLGQAQITLAARRAAGL